MSKMLGALIVMVCMNIMLTLGGFSVTNDIAKAFFDIDDAHNIQGLSSDLNSSIPRSVDISGQSEGGGEVDENDFKVTDIPKTLFSLFLFLLDVAFAPVSLMTSSSLGLPVEIRFMIGVPYGIIMIFLIIGWWSARQD